MQQPANASTKDCSTGSPMQQQQQMEWPIAKVLELISKGETN
jgi:hypothetical protein